VQIGAVQRQAGDLSELYRERYAPMVRLGTLLLGSQHLAEEVVQDCFLRLQPRFETLDDPAGYLHRSVVNGCRSLMRRQRRERDHLRATPGLPAELGAHELLDVLATLPERQRAALVLRFYADLSGNEIAAILGCREGTVKSLIHRGLARLREVVGE
jgi:RNA polymerase sigma factor (sigma-70 family)